MDGPASAPRIAELMSAEQRCHPQPFQQRGQGAQWSCSQALPRKIHPVKGAPEDWCQGGELGPVSGPGPLHRLGWTLLPKVLSQKETPVGLGARPPPCVPEPPDS